MQVVGGLIVGGGGRVGFGGREILDSESVSQRMIRFGFLVVRRRGGVVDSEPVSHRIARVEL